MRSVRFPSVRRSWPVLLGILSLTALVVVSMVLRGAPLRAQDGTTGGHLGHHMSAADMERWVREWYATHPASPTAVAAADAPVDTFVASGFLFDADHNAGTAIDNVHIFTGQSVLWQWADGSHTTTNGNGSLDPQAGVLWDAPLTPIATTFQRQFNQVGTFPFFCRPHEGIGMRGTVTVGAPAKTYMANGTEFDADGNLGTPVDTVFIPPGQAVSWRLVSGIHTVTNGTGSADPNAGKLFDVPLDPSNTVFTFTFNNLGTFPFFCRPHEVFGMKGVVVVTNQLAVHPVEGAPSALGFAAAPWPSPTRDGVSFRFALREAGNVRAEVYDAAGRQVAVVADGRYSAGTWEARWDGRTPSGGPATAGVYYLRLRLPGFSGTRHVVVVR